jgi:hypothetical protein
MLVLVQMAIFTLAMLPFFLNIYYQNSHIALRQNNNYKNSIILLSIFFLVFASYDGDWYHYWDIVNQLYAHPNSVTHLEEFQIWTILNLSFGNYLLWRLLIWGGVVFFLYKALERLQTNDLITWSIFIGMSIIQISTGRVYLGMSILLYGYSLIITSHKNLKLVLLGLGLIALSLFIHKSIFIYICAAIVSLIKFRKWMIVLALCCLPLLIRMFMNILGLYLLAGEIDNNVNSYLNQEAITGGLGINIYSYTLRMIEFVLFLCSTIFVYKYKQTELITLRIWQFGFVTIYSFLIVYGALTANNIGSTSISGRILMPLYYIIPILVSTMIKKRFKFNINLICITVLYLMGMYRLSYALYLQRLGAGI